jgi:hypothetical protein
VAICNLRAGVDYLDKSKWSRYGLKFTIDTQGTLVKRKAFLKNNFRLYNWSECWEFHGTSSTLGQDQCISLEQHSHGPQSCCPLTIWFCVLLLASVTAIQILVCHLEIFVLGPGGWRCIQSQDKTGLVHSGVYPLDMNLDWEQSSPVSPSFAETRGTMSSLRPHLQGSGTGKQ